MAWALSAVGALSAGAGGEDDPWCLHLQLQELLPLDLPLEEAMTVLPDGVYWQRRARHTWTPCTYPR